MEKAFSLYILPSTSWQKVNNSRTTLNSRLCHKTSKQTPATKLPNSKLFNNLILSSSSFRASKLFQRPKSLSRLPRLLSKPNSSYNTRLLFSSSSNKTSLSPCSSPHKHLYWWASNSWLSSLPQLILLQPPCSQSRTWKTSSQSKSSFSSRLSTSYTRLTSSRGFTTSKSSSSSSSSRWLQQPSNSIRAWVTWKGIVSRWWTVFRRGPPGIRIHSLPQPLLECHFSSRPTSQRRQWWHLSRCSPWRLSQVEQTWCRQRLRVRSASPSLQVVWVKEWQAKVWLVCKRPPSSSKCSKSCSNKYRHRHSSSIRTRQQLRTTSIARANSSSSRWMVCFKLKPASSMRCSSRTNSSSRHNSRCYQLCRTRFYPSNNFNNNTSSSNRWLQPSSKL